MDKTKLNFDFQNNLLKDIKSDHIQYIIGVDEVGRGPLAGDVFSCAVFIQEAGFSKIITDQVNDSKKISETKREYIFNELINNKNVYYGIGRVAVDIIDKINILQATFLSMEYAYTELNNKLHFTNENSLILIDGNIIPPFFKSFNNVKSIVSGDSLAISIAAASIIAKVTRDNYMRDLSNKFPEYKFDKNKGYGTKEHIDAIKKFGPCEIHRRSFLKKII